MIVYGSDACPLDSPAFSLSLFLPRCSLADTSRHRLTHDNAAVPLLRGTIPSASVHVFFVRPRNDRDDHGRVDPRFGCCADTLMIAVVVVRAIERLIRRGHRDDQPLPEKTSSRLILLNIIFVGVSGVSPPPLSADRSPPPSPLGQARRRSLWTLVRLAALLSLSSSLSANEIPFSARYRKCPLFASFRMLATRTIVRTEITPEDSDMRISSASPRPRGNASGKTC